MLEKQTRLYYVRDRKFPSITALIHHYSQFPLNPDVNTRLLYPVQGDQGDEYVALEPAIRGEWVEFICLLHVKCMNLVVSCVHAIKTLDTV